MDLARRTFVLGAAAGLGTAITSAVPAVAATGQQNPYFRDRGGPDLLRVRLPQRVAVIQPYTELFLLVRTQEPVHDVVVRLHNQKNTSPLSAADEVDSVTPRTETTVRLDFNDFQWAHWGWHEWKVWASRTLPDGSTVRSVRLEPVEVRPGSTLVSRASRSADVVTVTGEAQVYTTTRRRFVPWPGRPVLVERSVDAGWEAVGTTTTDERGRFRLGTRAPETALLRCTVVGTPSGWDVVGESLRA